MKIAMVKLVFALVSTGCVLLGVTLAAETNKRQQQQLVRNKRGLLSALFGGGGGAAESIQQQQQQYQEVDVPPTAEVLPIYGDPAQPPLQLLYGHSTGLPGPYPPYPVMFIPGSASLADGQFRHPMQAYGGLGSGGAPVQFQPAVAAGDSNYLPVIAGWPDAHNAQQQLPTTTATTTTASSGKPEPQPVAQPLDVSKSSYLQKLNLSPADEAELKRLSKQLGVTDFEHLPPFEDVMALLGTTTSAETIKAIKEYASTPDGLELIRDYVMSYQPAKRVSLGKEPYSDGNALDEKEPAGTGASEATTTPATPDVGFFARQFRRLKSILTFGYFGGSEDGEPMAVETAVADTDSESPQLVPVDVPASEPAPFVIRNEFPTFEVRDGAVRGPPVAHYIIPVRALPPHALSYAPDHRYASSVPFPLAVHYPPESQYPNPFTVVPRIQQEKATTTTTTTTPSPPTGDAFRRVPTVAPQRVAPPTLPFGELHTFERAELEQTERTTTLPSQEPVAADIADALTLDVVAPQSVAGLGPIVVEPEAPDATELSTNALDEN